MAKGRIYTYAIRDESGVYKIPCGSAIPGFTNPGDAKKGIEAKFPERENIIIDLTDLLGERIIREWRISHRSK